MRRSSRILGLLSLVVCVGLGTRFAHAQQAQVPAEMQELFDQMDGLISSARAGSFDPKKFNHLENGSLWHEITELSRLLQDSVSMRQYSPEIDSYTSIPVGLNSADPKQLEVAYQAWIKASPTYPFGLHPMFFQRMLTFITEMEKAGVKDEDWNATVGQSLYDDQKLVHYLVAIKTVVDHLYQTAEKLFESGKAANDGNRMLAAALKMRMLEPWKEARQKRLEYEEAARAVLAESERKRKAGETAAQIEEEKARERMKHEQEKQKVMQEEEERRQRLRAEMEKEAARVALESELESVKDDESAKTQALEKQLEAERQVLVEENRRFLRYFKKPGVDQLTFLDAELGVMSLGRTPQTTTDAPTVRSLLRDLERLDTSGGEKAKIIGFEQTGNKYVLKVQADEMLEFTFTHILSTPSGKSATALNELTSAGMPVDPLYYLTIIHEEAARSSRPNPSDHTPEENPQASVPIQKTRPESSRQEEPVRETAAVSVREPSTVSRNTPVEPTQIERPRASQPLATASASPGVTSGLSKVLDYVLIGYLILAGLISLVIVRPPLIRWYESHTWILSGQNPIDIFLKQIGFRIMFEAFVLLVACIFGACGGFFIALRKIRARQEPVPISAEAE